MDPIKNFAIGTLASGYDNVATTIALNTGDASKFPDPAIDGAFDAVWWNYTDYKNPSDDPNKEFVRITAVPLSDTFTITRGQQGTSASNKNTAGKIYKIARAVSKKDFDDIITSLSLKQMAFNGISEETPISANDISIDYNTRVLTIIPPLGYFDVFVDGDGQVNKFRKTGNVSFPAFTDTSGIWYFHFDSNGDPVTTQTAWTNFCDIAPVYRILWNNTLSGAAKSIAEALETHPNNISCADHAWKHRYGAIWETGLDLVRTELASGAPNSNGVNTCVGLTTGSCLDDNLEYTVVNSTGGLKFQQDLGPTVAANITTSNGALMKIRYDSGGLQYFLAATRFPFSWDISTNRPEYITSSGVRTLVPAGDYFVYFVYALQDPRNGDAIRLVSAPSNYGTLANARAVTWNDIQAIYPTLKDQEIRPLYKLIFQYSGAYNVAVKYTALREISDIRRAVITPTSAAGSVLASTVIFTPAGNISAGNVQSALEELDLEKLALAGGSLSGALNEAQGTDIASAATTNIAGATGNYVNITGTTTITALGTAQAGARRILRFSGSLTLTHNATSLILPTGANIITSAGDVAVFVSLGSGNWVCTGYSRANGTPLKTGRRIIQAYVIPAGTALTTGDGKAYCHIPADLNGHNVVAVSATLIDAVSSSGTPTIQIARGRQSGATSAHTFADILSTRITIDASEYDSRYAATAAVIDTANDDLATGDLLRFDIDVAGTGAKGLIVSLEVALP